MKHKNNIIKLCLGVFLALTMALPALAQKSVTFKGVVVDTTGEPIIGASVKVVGTTTGTITDLDGKFMVVVPSGKQVEISYIGYITQVLSDFKQTKIELKEDTQQLDEVVVVGYGTQKKAHLTGAIATVPMDDIQDLASGNLASTLSGMVNGLSVNGGDARPGENARINIRQNDVLSDIGGTASEPLYVIDGYIYPVEVKIGDVTENLGATAFNNLDPSVIESISVLKDAAAAVYGARAANGVILVTTKRGKQGAPKISYSGTFGVVDEVSRAKMLNAYQYGQLWNAVRAADPTDVSINLQNDLFQADELNAMKGLNYDLLDKYWKAALTQKHSINMTGGSERANYFGGISYFDQDGNLGNLDYNDFDGRNHVIKNLTCESGTYRSFFGVLCGECRNVGFVDANISSPNTGIGIIAGYVGLAAGAENYTGKITNCYTTGVLKGSGAAGGIGGVLGGSGYIKNCYSSATVIDQIANNTGKAGGIIGRVNGNASGSSIENCYTSGDINAIGGGNAGGIVGKVDGGKLVIKNCIAWNSMLVSTDKAKVGRIVGGTANATYENCYAYDGVILKAGEATFTVSDETSPSGSSFQGVAKSANELKNTVINWDSSLWKEGSNGYPVFKWSK